MFDEILEFFDRRKRQPGTDRVGSSRGAFDAFADDDDDEGDRRRRYPHDEDHRGDPRRDRFDRRDPGEGWD